MNNNNSNQIAKKDEKIMASRGKKRTITTLIPISIFSLMMLFSSSFSAAALPSIFAQTMASSNMGVVGSSTSSNTTMENMVLNLGTPLFIEHGRNINITNITQNTTREIFEGNGTFMLPPPIGRNMSVIESGNDLMTTTGGVIRVAGQVLGKTSDGKESATIDFARFTPINSTVGVGIAYIRTNSTTDQQQQLTSLNNTLMVYRSEIISPTEGKATFWQWR